MNDYKLIAESIWNTYSDMAYLLREMVFVNKLGQPLDVRVSSEIAKTSGRKGGVKHNQSKRNKALRNIQKKITAMDKSKVKYTLRQGEKVIGKEIGHHGSTLHDPRDRQGKRLPLLHGTVRKRGEAEAGS